MKTQLLLGCGHSRDKRMGVAGDTNPQWENMYSLDINGEVRPDFLGDLATPHSWYVYAVNSSPRSCELLDFDQDHQSEFHFKGDTFDEIHAYEVLEHLGAQGDYMRLFGQFSEMWRILKPDGYLLASCPSRYSPWLWGDPSHTRAILPQTLTFLDQSEYTRQLDGEIKTPMSDFRHVYKADFQCVSMQDNHEHFHFVLKAIKPSRYKAPCSNS